MRVISRCNKCHNIVATTKDLTLDEIRKGWDDIVIMLPSVRCKVCNDKSPSAMFDIEVLVVDDDGVEHPCSDYITSKLNIEDEVDMLQKMTGVEADRIMTTPIETEAEVLE